MEKLDPIPANLDEDDSFQIVVEECDNDVRHRSWWVPFTDIYGNEFAYSFEGADTNDKAVIEIACKNVNHQNRWVKFFSAPINMIHFEDAEEMETFFDNLFHSPRYKFFARPKHLHYKGYQKVEIVEEPKTEAEVDEDNEGKVTAVLPGADTANRNPQLPDKLPSLWDKILGNA